MNTPKPAAPSAEAIRSRVLSDRLHAHLFIMAPHQRERLTGKLLIEASAAIDHLQTVLRNLMPFVLEDYYSDCATPEFKAAVEAAKALCLDQSTATSEPPA